MRAVQSTALQGSRFARSKRHVTLLEVLIAMGLLTLLLSALFSFWNYADSVQNAADESRRKNFRQLYVQHRLGTVIPAALGKTKEFKPIFYTSYEAQFSGPSLVFAYDNGVVGEPEFANAVLGRLYVDHKGNLTLATWPSVERNFYSSPPMHKEILLTDVEGIRFEFFKPRKKATEEIKVSTKEEEIEARWYDEWAAERKALPALVKIHLNLGKNREATFGYVIPNTEYIVYYTK
jgi:hypothetical protein